MKTFGKTDGGDPNSVWEKMRTETLTQGVLSFGIAGKDAGKLQAGGGNVDFSVSNLAQVYDGIKAYSFHSSNVSSNEGKARITYVNTGVLSGNATAEKIAMDIFNGDKTLAFGLEAGHLGNAGWDGKTITLNSDAASFGENGLLSNNTLGIFTSVMAKEGSIIDHNLLHGNTQAGEEAKLKSGDAKQVLEVLADRFEREKVSYQVTEEVMNDLAKNLGIDVTDQKFKEQVGLAAQGRFGEAGVSWITGQDLQKTCMPGHCDGGEHRKNMEGLYNQLMEVFYLSKEEKTLLKLDKKNPEDPNKNMIMSMMDAFFRKVGPGQGKNEGVAGATRYQLDYGSQTFCNLYVWGNLLMNGIDPNLPYHMYDGNWMDGNYSAKYLKDASDNPDKTGWEKHEIFNEDGSLNQEKYKNALAKMQAGYAGVYGFINPGKKSDGTPRSGHVAFALPLDYDGKPLVIGASKDMFISNIDGGHFRGADRRKNTALYIYNAQKIKPTFYDNLLYNRAVGIKSDSMAKIQEQLLMLKLKWGQR